MIVPYSSGKLARLFVALVQLLFDLFGGYFSDGVAEDEESADQGEDGGEQGEQNPDVGNRLWTLQIGAG